MARSLPITYSLLNNSDFDMFWISLLSDTSLVKTGFDTIKQREDIHAVHKTTNLRAP